MTRLMGDACVFCGSTEDVWYTLPGSPERPVCKRCAIRKFPPKVPS